MGARNSETEVVGQGNVCFTRPCERHSPVAKQTVHRTRAVYGIMAHGMGSSGAGHDLRVCRRCGRRTWCVRSPPRAATRAATFLMRGREVGAGAALSPALDTALSEKRMGGGVNTLAAACVMLCVCRGGGSRCGG